jgi:hypothetical protein
MKYHPLRPVSESRGARLLAAQRFQRNVSNAAIFPQASHV